MTKKQTKTTADATKRDSRQLAKTVQFRPVGWCAAGINCHFNKYLDIGGFYA